MCVRVCVYARLTPHKRASRPPKPVSIPRTRPRIPASSARARFGSIRDGFPPRKTVFARTGTREHGALARVCAPAVCGLERAPSARLPRRLGLSSSLPSSPPVHHARLAASSVDPGRIRSAPTAFDAPSNRASNAPARAPLQPQQRPRPLPRQAHSASRTRPRYLVHPWTPFFFSGGVDGAATPGFSAGAFSGSGAAARGTLGAGGGGAALEGARREEAKTAHPTSRMRTRVERRATLRIECGRARAAAGDRVGRRRKRDRPFREAWRRRAGCGAARRTRRDDSGDRRASNEPYGRLRDDGDVVGARVGAGRSV